MRLAPVCLQPIKFTYQRSIYSPCTTAPYTPLPGTCLPSRVRTRAFGTFNKRNLLAPVDSSLWVHGPLNLLSRGESGAVAVLRSGQGAQPLPQILPSLSPFSNCSNVLLQWAFLIFKLILCCCIPNDAGPAHLNIFFLGPPMHSRVVFIW